MLWIKSFHIIFMVTWFSGLFYLPRLYVYHAQTRDKISIERFKVMEKKLFYSVMTPGGILTIIFGLYLWLSYGFLEKWMIWKFILVLFVISYHVWCYSALITFKKDKNHRSHVFYRWMNEMPVFALVGITILVIIKPH